MIDAGMINSRLAARFIGLARRAAASGYAAGSTSEQIVAALLNGRADWLPESHTSPLKAIRCLYAGGPEWYHTMLAVDKMDWQNEGERYPAETVG